MNRTYISSLLVVLVATQTIRAQESLDDVFAQLDAAQGSTEQVAPAEVENAQPAAVQIVAETDLLSRGLAYYRDGELGKADAVFEAVLAEDPYNRRAMEYLQRTAQKQAAIEIRQKRASRAQAMSDVDAAWNPDINVVAIPVDEDAVETLSDDEIAIEALSARLQSIIIPSLDFRDANIKDVVLFLAETCRRQDPTKQGVNILLLGMGDSMVAEQNNITISIRDMSLYEALQYIVEMASLKFDVQPRAVAVMPVGYVAPSDLKIVSYDIMPSVGEELASMADGDSGGGMDDLFGDASSSSSSSGPTDVVGFFSIVDWPDGSSATYQPNFHKLFVKNTANNHKSVKSILADLEEEAIKQHSQQVEIEAKFVEYNEGALEELGFSWTLKDDGTFAGLGFDNTQTYYQPGQGMASSSALDGGTLYNDPTSGYTQIDGDGQSLFGSSQRNNTTAFGAVQSGILGALGGTPAQMILSNTSSFPFDLAITAMEQEGTADVLSAPKVTTKSGSTAIIRVVEVHRYPQDYDVETGQRTAPVVKPQDWEDYDLGVVLEVTPVVDSERNTIDLSLQPEITKFVGYDIYIAGYNSYESGGSDEVIVFGNSAELQILMPYFETRAIETEVTIADGATVIMGGLVDERTETFRDQVPFLGDIPYIGRLFRSEGTRTSKMNLVISVKATQVDTSGLTQSQRELSRQASAK
ncbi:MAG: hypothetical protein V5783_05290 [Pontiella sp.]